MTDYQKPQIISSHSTDDLVSHAATCIKYPPPSLSDSTLKTDVQQIDRPLGGLQTPQG